MSTDRSRGAAVAPAPGAIVTRHRAAGPRATLAGTGLDVWEVVETLRLVGNSPARAARYLEIDEELVRAAAAYAARHRDEVDGHIARERERADAAQAEARAAP